jgi:hypothetical protein
MNANKTPTPFEEVYEIIDALTLEHHRLITSASFSMFRGEQKMEFSPVLWLAKDAVLRNHGWLTSEFNAEAAHMASKYMYLAAKVAELQEKKPAPEKVYGTHGLSRSDYRQFPNVLKKAQRS